MWEVGSRDFWSIIGGVWEQIFPDDGRGRRAFVLGRRTPSGVVSMFGFGFVFVIS